jgi:hypothetical protein
MNLDKISLCVDYSPSRPGAGKTIYTTKEMATIRGKYIYAVDRMQVFSDRKSLLINAATSTDFQVVEINSNESHSVREDVREVPAIYTENEHVVVICTHEALMTSDLSMFKGWHLRIDEIPSCWMHTEMNTKASKEQLTKYFNIRKQRRKDYYKITVKENVDIDAIRNDTYLKDISTIYKAAKNGIAYTATKKFCDVWDWWTIFDFKELQIFDSVKIVGNAFEQSLTFKLMSAHGVTLNKFLIPEYATYQPRKLTIKYFDEYNRATAHFFGGPTGKYALNAVGKYLTEHPVDIWSCNNAKDDMDYENLIGYQKPRLSPCVAGSNSYADMTSAAYIFSAKPGKMESGRLQDMGINFDDVVRSREIEPMIQFATRLSIRDPENSADNTFYVYGKEQAEEVQKFFDNLAIGITTELEFIDLAVPVVFRTKQDIKAKKSALNRAAYERKKAAKWKI